jgi:sugar/nucleoside kinase (ribokinase family)
MKLTATKLRENIYAILDQVLATGQPVEIERNGRTLRLQAVDTGSRLDRVVPRADYIIGNPEDLVELDWSQEWSELTPSALIPMPSSGSSAASPKSSGRKRGR